MADLYTPYRNYVKKMLTFQGREKGTAKVLILDNETVRDVRLCWFILCRRSPLPLLTPRARFWTMMVCFCFHLPDELVFLTERIGTAHEDMKHLIVGFVVS